MRWAGAIFVTIVLVAIFFLTDGAGIATMQTQDQVKPSAPVQGTPSDNDLKGLKIN